LRARLNAGGNDGPHRRSHHPKTHHFCRQKANGRPPQRRKVRRSGGRRRLCPSPGRRGCRRTATAPCLPKTAPTLRRRSALARSGCRRAFRFAQHRCTQGGGPRSTPPYLGLPSWSLVPLGSSGSTDGGDGSLRLASDAAPVFCIASATTGQGPCFCLVRWPGLFSASFGRLWSGPPRPVPGLLLACSEGDGTHTPCRSNTTEARLTTRWEPVCGAPHLRARARSGPGPPVSLWRRVRGRRAPGRGLSERHADVGQVIEQGSGQGSGSAALASDGPQQGG